MERRIVRRTESHLEGADGKVLFRRSWLSPLPRHVLLLVHGFAEHSGRYDSMGAWFADRAFAVHAYDQRGHGRSQGRRCHVDAFSLLLDDLDVVLERVRAEHAGLPVTLVGHSMGGLVVTSFLVERQPAVVAAVTSGAALRLPADVSRSRLVAARFLRRLFPHTTLDGRIDPEALSQDPRVVRRYIEDPLVERRMTLSFAGELLGAIQRIESRAGEVRVPMLLLHGEEDRLCSTAASHAFHAGLQVEGSDLRTYPGLRHEIFNEPKREEVFLDVVAWLQGSGVGSHGE